MAVINTGRFNRGVQKALGIKGEIVIPDLDSALQASIDVTDVPTELRMLFGWRSYCAPLLNTGNANNFDFSQLANPAGSNVIAVIERWRMVVLAVTANDVVCELMRDPAAGTTVPALTRDDRSGPTVTGAVCQPAAGNAAALSGTRAAYIPADATSAVATYYDIVRGDGRDELVITPGHNWTAWTHTNPVGGETIFSTIWWRERALDPSELTA